MKKKDLWLISVSLTLPAFVHALTPDPCCGVKFNGYVDASFNYLESANQFRSEIFDRAFDIKEDGFTLQQLAATLAYQPEKGAGGLVNVLYGRDAIITGPYGYNTQTGDGPIGFDVLQAYAQYASAPATVLAGRFVTLAGYEVVDSTMNNHYSRSLLFTFAIPISHLGLRTSFKLRNQLQFIVGVNNGWDNVRDTSRDKTLEFGIQYNCSHRLSLAGTAYSGEERIVPRTSSGPEGRRNLIDLIATYKLTNDMHIAANYDYGVQHHVLADVNALPINAVWQGLALYYAYAYSPLWRASIRGEIFDDRDGYRTGIRQSIKEFTLTIGYSPIKNLEIRAETRRDFSNEYAYIDRDSNNVRKTQQSYALEAIYKFSNAPKAKSPFMLEPSIVKAIPPAANEIKHEELNSSLSEDEQYLMAMDPNHYIVQLLGASSDMNVAQFIIHHGLQDQAHYFHTTRKSKDWYVIVYGDYQSKAAADQAKQTLQQRLNIQPWVRRVSDVQNEIGH